MKSSVLWRSLILACMASAVVTLLPWPSSRANFLGYNSVCSFTPFASITLLAIAVCIYAYAAKKRRMLRVAILALILIAGFISWWFFVFALPMRTLNFHMSISSFAIGTNLDGENASSITYYLTIENPSERSTPLFIIEPAGLRINDKTLTSGYHYHCHNGNRQSSDFHMFYERTTLGPRENLTLGFTCIITYDRIEVEDATRESVWASLKQADFTFSMSGVLTARPFFSGDFPRFIEDREIWAARTFVVSQHYT